MMKKLLVRSNFLVLIVLTLMIFLSAGLVTQVNAGGNANALQTKIASDTYARLQAQAQEQGQVRLIVHLDVDFDAKEMALGGAAAENQRKRIREAQSLVTDSMSQQKAEVLYNYEFVPFNVVTVDPAALDALLALPSVRSVEEDKIEKADLAGSIPIVNAAAAWSSGYSGAGQVVAILDTGVDKNHEFLTGKVVSEACYSDNYYGYPSSQSICPGGVEESTAINSAMPYGGICPTSPYRECDHGTHVAGIAAGKRSDFSGVARDAGIIAIQVFARFDNYCGYPCALSWSSDQLKGLERVYQLRNTYNIAAVNMSIGGGEYTSYCDDDPRKTAIELLQAAGIATVVSSGNNGFVNALSSPACISSAISVGATTKNNTVDVKYSNSASFLTLLAPGASIYSSLPNGYYGSWSGTSMAAPHVTGAWAVIKSRKPSASVGEIYDALINTGLPIRDTRNNIIKPQINIDAALEINFNGPTNLTGITPAAADYIDLTWTDNSSKEDGFIVERRGTDGSWEEIGTVGANVTTFRDSSAVCDTSYEYRVKSDTAYGASLPNNWLHFKLVCPVTNIVAEFTQQRVSFSWVSNNSSEIGFRVERSPDGISSWMQVGEDLPSGSEDFTDYPLICGTTYDYRVTVFNDIGYRISSTINATTLPCTAPPQPVVTAGPLSTTALQLNWPDVGDYETGYMIQRASNAGGSFQTIATVGRDVTSYQDNNLFSPSTFFYRVIAVNSNDGAGSSSTPSNPSSATTYPVGGYLPIVVE